MTITNPYQLFINGVQRQYIKIHYVKNHPSSDPDTFDIIVNYDVGQLVNYFDPIEIKKNGVTEFYGFIEDKNEDKGSNGLEYRLTGRDWKLLLWKKWTERYIETREVGPSGKSGFFGKVNPKELILFLLRTPISLHPASYIRQKIGWGIPADAWTCTAIRTATSHHPQWTALREIGFEWQLGATKFENNLLVDGYTQDLRQWITSDDTVQAVDNSYPVDEWVFVNNDWTHVNTEPWLHDDDEVNYITLPATKGEPNPYDDHYHFQDVPYDAIYTTLVNLVVKGKLYDGVGGHADSITIRFYLWNGSSWLSGAWAFTSTNWETVTFNFSTLNTIAKLNGTKLKIEYEEVSGGGADKGGIEITYAYLHVHGTGITWGNANNPWLITEDNNYIEGRISGDPDYSYMSYFTFANVPAYSWRPNSTIETVDLKLDGRNVIIGGSGRQVMVRPYIWDGSSWIDTGTDISWTTGETSWTTKTLDIKTILDTINKINSARLKLYFIGVGLGGENDVSYVQITMTYLHVVIQESSYQQNGDWFKINMGDLYDRVTAILIEDRSDVAETGYARNFSIQVSNDNFITDIRTVYTKANNNARDILASWSPEDDVQYIRILLTNGAAVPWRISQIYVWQTEELKYRLLDET